MPFYSGTMPTTPNPALDMMALLDPILTANGYTYIETYTNAADVTRIYKSPAAANGVGDWFLYMRRTADNAAGVTFTVSEAWDATNKKVQRYIPSASATPVPAANYTINDAAGQTPNTTASIRYYMLATAAASTTSTAYWVSVTAQRFIVASRFSTSNNALYVGLGDEVMPETVGGYGLPLGVLYMYMSLNGSGTTGDGGSTREPNTSTPVTGAFNVIIPYSSSQFSPFYGFSSLGSNDIYTTRPWLSRLIAQTGRSGQFGPRFLLKDVLGGGVNGAVNGDTVTVGSSTYVLMTQGTSGFSFVDQAV